MMPLLAPNVTVHAGEIELAMRAREPFACRCGGVVAVAFMPDEPGVGAILHTVPPCPPYVRLGIRDFYDYLQTGREPKPIAASGEIPKPVPRSKR